MMRLLLAMAVGCSADDYSAPGHDSPTGHGASIGPCPVGQITCHGACVSTDVDQGNCGGCGIVCDHASECHRGVCAYVGCPAGSERCTYGGDCNDLQRDHANCGACGVGCHPSERCEGGACVLGPCTPPSIACGRDCVDVTSDARSCGACGVVCPSDSDCTGGTCVPRCSGMVRCGEGAATRCLGSLGDVADCGACGHRCPEGPDGARCLAGQCVSATCIAGAPTCPGDAPTCGSNLRVSNVHCGACGHACGDGAHCLGGNCVASDVRPVEPLSTMHVTSHRPRFRWELGAGVGGVRLEICSDRACTHVERSEDVTGTQFRPDGALASGWHWWRLHAIRAGVVEATPGPTWQFFLDATDAPIPTATESMPDFNGDGIADALEFVAAGLMIRFGAGAGPTIPPLVFPHEAGIELTDLGQPNVGFAGVDFDGDGLLDLVMHARFSIASGSASSEGVIVGYGTDRGTPMTDTLITLRGSDLPINDFTPCGDHDGDGFGDVAVTSGPSGVGRPYSLAVVFGGSTPARQAMGFWSHRSIGCADFNGDGLADILGFECSQAPGFPENRPAVRYGSAGGGLPASEVPACTTVADPLGVCSAAVSDRNGDGYPDLTASESPPAVTITWFGGPDGLVGTRCVGD